MRREPLLQDPLIIKEMIILTADLNILKVALDIVPDIRIIKIQDDSQSPCGHQSDGRGPPLPAFSVVIKKSGKIIRKIERRNRRRIQGRGQRRSGEKQKGLSLSGWVSLLQQK